MLSLTRHILEQQQLQADGAEDLSAIMNGIVSAGKKIARDLSVAGLTDSLGMTGERNVHGERVQRMDARANELFVEAFQDSAIVQIVVSEEMDEPFVVGQAEKASPERSAAARRRRKPVEGTGKYAVFFDPLDGSSNVDVNAPLGSIFSIHRMDPAGNFLKTGSEQVAAGYLLYGIATILVYTCGEGVHQFTLDPEGGEFLLSASNIRIPSRGKIYSVNEGNRYKWSKNMVKVIDHFHAHDKAAGRPYASRYTGCLVADVHRILLKGGLYLYPGDVQKPEGKLRLMYEAAPLSFVVEQAGGIGSTGVERISAIHPKTPHQCVPLVIGSREDVETTEQFFES